MAEWQDNTSPVLVVEEHVVFSFSALCRASGADAEQVQALIVEGLLQPSGNSPADWTFSGHAMRQARTALRLAHDLELSLSGTALVMDLLAEIEALRLRLHHR